MNIEKYVLENDIKVFYIKAKSFPDGVLEAHQKLHSLISENKKRNYYGLSKPVENGKIVYKASAEELFDGEAEKLNCETFVIEKGNYSSILIENYLENIENIGKAFQKLLKDPNLDPDSFCVEIYLGKNDIRCLVKVLG